MQNYKLISFAMDQFSINQLNDTTSNFESNSNKHSKLDESELYIDDSYLSKSDYKNQNNDIEKLNGIKNKINKFFNITLQNTEEIYKDTEVILQNQQITLNQLSNQLNQTTITEQIKELQEQDFEIIDYVEGLNDNIKITKSPNNIQLSNNNCNDFLELSEVLSKSILNINSEVMYLQNKSNDLKLKSNENMTDCIQYINNQIISSQLEIDQLKTEKEKYKENYLKIEKSNELLIAENLENKFSMIEMQQRIKELEEQLLQKNKTFHSLNTTN